MLDFSTLKPGGAIGIGFALGIQQMQALTEKRAMPQSRCFMMQKIIASAIIAGAVSGYVALLYALVHIAVLIDRSYFMSLTLQQ